ncbi:MAG: hypothetical protein V3W18_06185 [candidate division Zixibacteria bacterium]
METASYQSNLKPLETRAIAVGLILVGLAIIITGISYLINMTFTYQWLVWAVGLTFIAVGSLTIESARRVRYPSESEPKGRFRQILLFSIPCAFILSSQVCGLGIRACNTVCHLSNLSLIALAVITAIRLYRRQSVGGILIPMVVIGLIPHCVCHAPINVLWHSILGGVSPACEMIPLAASLIAVMALRGIRIRPGSVLIAIFFGVMIFIIIGGLFLKFLWQGCVDHPIMPR